VSRLAARLLLLLLLTLAFAHANFFRVTHFRASAAATAGATD